MVAEEVRKAQYKVDNGSKYCDYWLDKHINCVGCESEEGCKVLCQLVAIAQLAFLKFMLMDNTDDAIEHTQKTRILIRRILDKKKKGNNHGVL